LGLGLRGVEGRLALQAGEGVGAGGAGRDAQRADHPGHEEPGLAAGHRVTRAGQHPHRTSPARARLLKVPRVTGTLQAASGGAFLAVCGTGPAGVRHQVVVLLAAAFQGGPGRGVGAGSHWVPAGFADPVWGDRDGLGDGLVRGAGLPPA
jgi:hypothetical protein